MSLRPNTLSEIVGQEQVVTQLNILVKSAKMRRDVIGHALFCGPAGTGKTTLARAVANDMNANISELNGANIGGIKTLLPILAHLRRGDILFIDEIHRAPKNVQEFLFPVMEDFKLDMGKDDSTMSIPLKQFTLVGATTETGSLLKPLLDRFPNKVEVTPYTHSALVHLAELNLKKLNIQLEQPAIQWIAKIARGVPRILNAYLTWLRDYSVAFGLTYLNLDTVEGAMHIAGIDADGYDSNDRLYMLRLAETMAVTKNPVGLPTLVASTGLSEETITNKVEPYLLQTSKIMKTGKGRVLTELWKGR